MLNEYLRQTMSLARDQSQKYLNPQDLISYINQSRRMIALRTQCVRIKTFPQGAVRTATITAPGSGYVNPVATISAPDFTTGALLNPLGSQATALVQQQQGAITNISITNGGSGYFSPVIAIADASGPGHGATATLQITPITQTQNGQEIYNFSDIPLSDFPGVAEVFWVNSVAIIYAAFRYVLMKYSFTTYQAKIRNYPTSYTYVPSVCAQLGQGTSGSLYMYPVASASYQLELDCFCLPSDLTDDTSFEAIPQPWQDCVQWYALHLAYLDLQNLNAAEYYRKLADARITDFSAWGRPYGRSNPYGRW
jgi:hypothetical protein